MCTLDVARLTHCSQTEAASLGVCSTALCSCKHVPKDAVAKELATLHLGVASVLQWVCRVLVLWVVYEHVLVCVRAGQDNLVLCVTRPRGLCPLTTGLVCSLLAPACRVQMVFATEQKSKWTVGVHTVRLVSPILEL
jgi:hypothetical protein